MPASEKVEDVEGATSEDVEAEGRDGGGTPHGHAPRVAKLAPLGRGAKRNAKHMR